MSNRRRRKAPSNNSSAANHGGNVNDLMIAQMAAMATLSPRIASSASSESGSDADSEESDDESESPSIAEDQDDPENENANPLFQEVSMEEETPPIKVESEPIKVESDDESDVDLSLELSKMNDSDGEDTNHLPKRKNNKTKTSDAIIYCKTQNEIDAYETLPQPEMGSCFEIDGREANVSTAGKVQSHLVDDRILVIQSVDGAPPLDEGSVLFMKMQQEDNKLLAVGKVFEVFGPVTRPLYTVRLTKYIPPPKPVEAAAPPQIEAVATEKDDEMDGNEIDIDANQNETETETEKEVIIKEESDSTKSIAVDVTSPPQDKVTDQTEKESMAVDIITPPPPQDKVADQTEKKSMTVDVATPAPPQDKVTDQTKKEAVVVEKKDPWSPNGTHTQWVKLNASSCTVFYKSDVSAVINTNRVHKMSGKGCDASNMYDEEVEAFQLEYSDDEQERTAKADRKKKRDGTQKSSSSSSSHNNPNSQRVTTSSNHNNNARGGGRRGTSHPPPAMQHQMHTPNTAPQYHQAPQHGYHVPYATAPQYPTPQQPYYNTLQHRGIPPNAYQQPQNMYPGNYQQPNHFVPGGGNIPPPPPPPANQPHYPMNNNRMYPPQQQPPQPPQPPSQEGDTVYYNYGP